MRFDTGNPALRGDYLKLLLFVLQRRKLIGPFATIPDDKPLEQFPDEINVTNFSIFYNLTRSSKISDLFIVVARCREKLYGSR